MCDTHNACEGGPVFADITVTPEQIAALNASEAKVTGPNRCPTCDAPQLGVHYHESDEYEPDPDEVTPCLVCGEPKPNKRLCLDSDCSMFGGARRFVALTFQVAAYDDDAMPNADSIREWVEEACREEGMFDSPDVAADTGLPMGPWLEQINVEPINAA